jgi:hypothetical protein
MGISWAESRRSHSGLRGIEHVGTLPTDTNHAVGLVCQGRRVPIRTKQEFDGPVTV